MTPFHFLLANQSLSSQIGLRTCTLPTKKPDSTFIGRSFGVLKTIPKNSLPVKRREYNTYLQQNGLFAEIDRKMKTRSGILICVSPSGVKFDL